MNRDKRRSETKPNRSQADEDREADRKRKQAKNRGNASTDPNNGKYGNKDFQNERNAKNKARCAKDGTNCNYSGKSRNDDDEVTAAAENTNNLRGAVYAAIDEETAAEKTKMVSFLDVV